ncbi:hypothetical protein L6452_43268 [Arctium lappa]|uniref:Uncharacterized protein n=1 Tax=Arctium lappa TaxID=4217 RepID=A0ACB8XPN6_ARCLA|nr:hypothetical protein L6452_43268 [Arctium lappa]
MFLGFSFTLFNFILNSFLSRGTKRVTLGTTTTTNAASASDVRSRALERNPNQDHVIRPDGGHDPSPEILVEFRHTNGATVKQRSNGSDHVSVRENATRSRQRRDQRDQGDGNESGSGSGENVAKRSDLIIRDGANLPGRRHHLLSVASNINEKADAFIRSRKEAMEKNLSLKQVADM